jgi:putative inorganic carbon (hco3(-)) transporter
MIFFYWLIVIMPLENHPFWGAFIGPLTVVKYLGIFCVFYAMLYLPLRKAPLPFNSWQVRFFVLFYLMATVSYVIKGRHVAVELSPFMTYTSFLVLFLVTMIIVDSPKRLRWVLLAAVASIGLSSIYVLREWQKGGFVGGVRPGWIGGGTNDYAISPLLCLPIAYYLLIMERRPLWERLFCLGCLVLGLTSVIFGASRGGFIGLSIATLYIIWRSSHRLRNIGLLLVLVVPLLAITPASPIRRLIAPGRSDQMSTANHLGTLKAGIRMAAAHPFFGVGLGNYRLVVLQYAENALQKAFVAHNVYLEIAAEMGFPALLIYLLMLSFAFKNLGRTQQADDPLIRTAASGIYAGLLGASVALFFVSAYSNKLYWLMFSLAASLPGLTSLSSPERSLKNQALVRGSGAGSGRR